MVILDRKEFQDLWNALPEFLLRRRLERAYKLIKPVIKKQLLFLDKYEKSKNETKYVGHIYVFNTVKDFWDKANLTFLMGQKKLMRNFTFYPVRTCMENLMRFMYFCKKTQIQRDIIASKELLRIYARLYKRELLDGAPSAEYIKAYKSIADGLDVPSIEYVNDKDLDPFPGMALLCNLSGMKDPKKLYFLYQCLCEDAHGKVIATVMRYQSEKFEPYRRALMLLVMFCKEMLILVDKHFLGARLRDQVEACIKKVDTTVKRSKSFYEQSYVFIKRIIKK